MMTNRPSYAVFFVFCDSYKPRKQLSKAMTLPQAMAKRAAYESMADSSILDNAGGFVVINLESE